MSDTYTFLLPILMCVCFGAFFVALAGGIIFWAVRSSREADRAWTDVAARTGLAHQPGSLFSRPQMSGEYRRRPIRVYTYSTGAGEHRTTYTAVSLTVNNASGSMLGIAPSNTVGSFLGKVFNAQDVEIGDPAFDERFVIKSSPPEFAPQVLGDARVRAEITDIPGAFHIGLEGPSLTYSKAGLEGDAGLLMKMFDTLSDLADRFEARSGF